MGGAGQVATGRRWKRVGNDWLEMEKAADQGVGRGDVDKAARDRQDKWIRTERERGRSAITPSPVVESAPLQKERLLLKVCSPHPLTPLLAHCPRLSLTLICANWTRAEILHKDELNSINAFELTPPQLGTRRHKRLRLSRGAFRVSRGGGEWGTDHTTMTIAAHQGDSQREQDVQAVFDSGGGRQAGGHVPWLGAAHRPRRTYRPAAHARPQRSVR